MQTAGHCEVPKKPTVLLVFSLDFITNTDSPRQHARWFVSVKSARVLESNVKTVKLVIVLTLFASYREKKKYCQRGYQGGSVKPLKLAEAESRFHY